MLGMVATQPTILVSTLNHALPKLHTSSACQPSACRVAGPNSGKLRSVKGWQVLALWLRRMYQHAQKTRMPRLDIPDGLAYAALALDNYRLSTHANAMTAE